MQSNIAKSARAVKASEPHLLRLPFRLAMLHLRTIKKLLNWFYSIARLLIRPSDSGRRIVSRPALATITAMYGTTTAPARVTQRHGLGRKIVAMKQAVRNIIE